MTPVLGSNQLVIANMALPLGGLKILKTQGSSGTVSSVFYDASFGKITRGVYQVPVGKVFLLRAFKWFSMTSTGNTLGVQLMYSDDDDGLNSAGSLTNPIGLISGITPNVADYVMIQRDQVGGNVNELAIGGQAPAGKYINVGLGNSAYGSFICYGYEVDA